MSLAKRMDIVNGIAGSLAPMTMLDIGCGACTVADVFVKHGHDVYVSDIMRHRVPKSWYPRFTSDSALDIPLNGYDCIILAGLLYHLSSESQVSVCERMKDKLVLLDTHYVETKGKGEPRDRTASSEPKPVIPSMDFIRTRLFPDHFILQTQQHTEDRSWFMCIPHGMKLSND